MKTTRILGALLLCIALPAQAIGRFTDASDLWWNAAEPGWGVNVIQQNEVMFITFFVYSASRNPVWYSASEVQYQGNVNGVLTYQGALYETHGPSFRDFYDAPSVTYRQVGSVIFRLNPDGTAALVYTVDGFTVQKALTRFTWRANDIAGSYFGAQTGTYSSCPSPTANGYREENGLSIVVTQTASDLSIQATGSAATCIYTGRYSQQGRLGNMSGAFTCTNGVTGSFDAFEIEANPQAFSAKLASHGNACSFFGRIGGVRRGT